MTSFYFINVFQLVNYAVFYLLTRFIKYIGILVSFQGLIIQLLYCGFPDRMQYYLFSFQVLMPQKQVVGMILLHELQLMQVHKGVLSFIDNYFVLLVSQGMRLGCLLVLLLDGVRGFILGPVLVVFFGHTRCLFCYFVIFCLVFLYAGMVRSIPILRPSGWEQFPVYSSVINYIHHPF